jgi:rare lipoprotein A
MARTLVLSVVAALLAGCGVLRLPGIGSGSGGGSGSGDTEVAAPAPAAPPPIAAAPKPPPAPRPVPDAVPRVETIRQGAPNLPYEIRGESYEPAAADVPVIETGVASWYGSPFHGRRTANGEVYDMHAMTAAHRTMPLPSYAKVRNLANGREIVVRVNDRGPFKKGRIIDLSRAAARKLGITGIARVEVRRLMHDEIRTGAWKAPPGSVPRVAAAARREPAPASATRVEAAKTFEAGWRGSRVAAEDSAPAAAAR